MPRHEVRLGNEQIELISRSGLPFSLREIPTALTPTSDALECAIRTVPLEDTRGGREKVPRISGRNTGAPNERSAARAREEKRDLSLCR